MLSNLPKVPLLVSSGGGTCTGGLASKLLPLTTVLVCLLGPYVAGGASCPLRGFPLDSAGDFVSGGD